MEIQETKPWECRSSHGGEEEERGRISQISWFNTQMELPVWPTRSDRDQTR